jgi:uncharacterized protein (TIGR02147 family)
VLDIYKYPNYKNFLSSLIKKGPRGFQSALAQGIGCQASYLIQVLNDKGDLTEEQALRLTQFLKLDDDRAEYFFLLVCHARSQTKELKEYYLRKLHENKNNNENIKNRVPKNEELNLEKAVFYFSNWDVSVVHLATSVEELQTPSALATRFKIPPKRIEEILKFLIENEMVTSMKGRYCFKGSSLYLPKDSVLNLVNQLNSRALAEKSLRSGDIDSLHFSSKFVIAKKDFEELKKNVRDFIEQEHKKIPDSKCEDVYSLVIDVFRVF